MRKHTANIMFALNIKGNQMYMAVCICAHRKKQFV